jgi:GT2 family glycosyltransferase
MAAMTWRAGHAVTGNRWDLLDGMTPAVPPRVSVIVAHYRQARQLARTLRALAAQDYPTDRLELIVADDGSPEPPSVPATVRVVSQVDAGFRLAAVRNLGAAHATGDLLVFLDADTTPEPAYVRELTRLPALAPDVVTVGRRRHARLDGVSTSLDITHAVRGRELPEPAWLVDGYRETRDLLHADDRSYRYLIGAVLACSKQFFDIVGGFDESFTAYGGEDWEWAYRAWIAGGVFAHVRAAVAWHDGSDAAERMPGFRPGKNAEALRLADLVPLPGSRGRGMRPQKVDIAVTGPPGTATPAQSFVSVDSVLAALPGAELCDADGDCESERFDRVRLHLEILRPLQVRGDDLSDAVRRIERQGLGELVLTDSAGSTLIRITASRAQARAKRWARDDLFQGATAVAPGIRAIPPDVNVEAYLGGWE